jgi:MFS family permease
MKLLYRQLTYVLAFLTGFSFMGYEILGSRILAPYFGGSVYTWGAIISVFMLGLSIGYAFGGKIADLRKKFSDLFLVFIFAFLYLSLVSVFGKYVCIVILNIDFDVKYLALLTSLILFFVPGILWGIILPYLIKLSECVPNNIGSYVGKIYSISTAGSIIGVFIVSFYMVGYFGTVNNIRLLCIPLLLCCVIVKICSTKIK